MSDINNLRGEIIINNAKLASIEGQTGVHDSQILFGKVQKKDSLIVLYTCSDGYYLNVINPNTNEIVNSHKVAVATGWAPRMYRKSADIIRIMYTKNKTDVYYRDFEISTSTLIKEAQFKVAIKGKDGKHDTPIAFTLDRFLEHCANVTGIDYRSSAYDGFDLRNLLVEDTQQLQKVGDKYYLTAEVLADKIPAGDCGGIACLIWSKDLDTWYLNDPIRLVEDINDQRDHEVSATYINGKWHALTRHNKYTFGPPSGFRHYTSNDGEKWELEGLLDIPKPHGGIRHAVYKMDLLNADPVGSDSNKTTKQVAFILYQKIPGTYAYNEYDDKSHRLRTELSLVCTADFINFHVVANICDRAQLHYPSITMHKDRLYVCWTSEMSGENFISSIQWSSYNLSSIR